MMPRHGALAATTLLLAVASAGVASAAEMPGSPRVVARGGADATDAKRLKAQRELEALLLQTLVASAFTKNDSRLFGTGTAGRQWQAMMTEHVARAMAASGQIRIFPAGRGKAAGRLPANAQLPSHVMRGPQSLPGWVTVATPESMAASMRTVANDIAR